jgi:hypothetical protein
MGQILTFSKNITIKKRNIWKNTAIFFANAFFTQKMKSSASRHVVRLDRSRRTGWGKFHFKDRNEQKSGDVILRRQFSVLPFQSLISILLFNFQFKLSPSLV